MKKIFIIGGATQDIFIYYEGAESMHLHNVNSKKSYLLFQEGIKLDVKKIHYSTGGGATNTATGIGRLGLLTSAYFKISDDVAGKFILEELKKLKIDLSNVSIDNSLPTAISFILPSLENNYTALCFRGINSALKIDQEELDILKNYDYLYITSLSGQAASILPELAQKAKENNVLVITNPGTHQFLKYFNQTTQALKFVDILIFNAYEAKNFLQTYLHINKINTEPICCKEKNVPTLIDLFFIHNNTKLTLYNLFNEIFKIGPKIIIVTDGSRGVYVGTPEYILFHEAIKPEKIISTLGAGDAFGSAFIATLAQNKPLEEALVKGIINSTSVIEHIDAKTGQLDSEDLEKRFKKIGLRQLKKYYWN